MDQASRSSEPPRDRAVSAEPCSTRPNPFDDGDSSRKRRRTSLSGSRSLSTDAERSPSAQGDDPSTSATLVDSLPEVHTGMSMDTDPSTPQTPERPPPVDDACPSERASSRVTLNLRQPDLSSPGSPTPHNLGDVGPPDSLVGGDVKPSVEDPGDDMRDSGVTLDGPVVAATAAAVTPTSSLSSSPSPPDIEVIDIPDDEDDNLIGDDEPELSIIGEQRNTLHDPTVEFPYNDTELQLDTVNRLSNYMSNSDPPVDETVLESLHIWIDAFLRWAELVGYRAAYASCLKHSALWRALPELMWAIGNRNHLRMAMSHPIISTFSLAFARLTAFFVTLDSQTLANVIREEAPVVDRNGFPEVFSSTYLASLHNLIRREEPRIMNDLDDPPSWPRTDTISVLIHRFQQSPGLSLQGLTKLVNAQIELMDRFPKFVDHPAAACQLVSDIVWEAERRLRFLGATSQILEQSAQLLVQGHKFYLAVSQALSRNIDKLVNHLTQDGTSGQILSLTDIYHCVLRGDHELATEVLSAHQEAHPELPAQLGPGAIAWEWRFNMFGRLIMSGQMTLRVWAVSSMCTDLVMFWKRWGEQRDEVGPFLRYFAQYLMRTKLVEYILGPSCHPEITADSGNVVGFLLVTRFYRKEQTDLLWKTITTTQDPRVADALTRMTITIAPLCDQDNLLYICEKLLSLPIEAFATPSVRQLCEQVFKQLVNKFHAERTMMTFLPYELCLRLLRESSVPSTGSQVAYPDIHVFATQKLRDLHLHGPDLEGRRRIYLTCIQDIAAKSPTTLGSLGGLFISIRHTLPIELRVLCTDHDLPRLVIEELEHAISASRSASGQPVLVGASCVPRRDFITSLICHAPDTLVGELGKRLWDMLVGPHAACEADWDPAWRVLEEATRQTSWDNSFISTCLSAYYPTLPSRCLCMGALRFLKLGILPRVAGSEIALDNDESVRDSGIGELWRIVLTAPDQQVADCAIDVLVKDIHIDSAAILSYPHHRARQVHLKLVTRCLEQLGEAARKILASSEGTASGDDEPMVIVETETEMLEQERVFIRSLALLRLFLQTHRSKAHFATADIRPLMPPSPTMVEGESAELKFQSFDGDTQTDVRPLNIGRQNTAGSLLASLRDATGFENYRIYYKGQVFQINETEICKSLDDLHIRNGLILVKREEDGTSPSARVKPGTSPLEIEILGHFDELWGYLSLEERFAQEIYQFLVKLPADSHILELIDSPTTPYQELFPPGQPFKCLYAGYALAEYTEATRRQGPGPSSSAAEGSAPSTSYKDSLERALMLLFSAIREPKIIDRCPSDDLKSQLSVQLMTGLVDLLIAYKEFVTSQQTDWAEVVPPSRRLLDIARTAASAPENEYSLRLISATYSAMLLLSVLSTGFWDEVTRSDTFGLITQDLLLDNRPGVRGKINQTIKDACLNDHPLKVQMANFFWPWVSGVIPKLTEHPLSCHECFELTEFLMLVLLPAQSPILDLAQLAKQCCSLLLELTSSEDIRDSEPDDAVVGGLIRLLRCSTEIDKTTLNRSAKLFPSNAARELFWRYLFPLERLDGEPIPSVLLNNTSRTRLYDIIFDMVKTDGEQFRYLLDDLKELVPYEMDEHGDPYYYDLPTQFERSKAIRSTCGYVGLRNLSNTCYLNSLFTQLFMNTDFRRFILSAGIGDTENQRLLFATQKLFAYMQESIRRFVDPYAVVNSIKTYDDTEIDVHNQMDVDEFYNLLFDRWESQLLAADERKTLRSFYGGQLVQQVTSRECEHVSERLEPFSAIQCDIKGKATLQESLEAYVGGEVMEGDNKYKCSTCDKHVNAVKRACLKDLPDNLIFHLKRFDFNLRLMQRSKINDYFSFPTKIDMRPYTIEHLSNPTKSGPEDVFELVGILVHSGTAESGHYYSYIRERPSSGKGDTWVEFNDDLVTPWDPETMESSTFGGQDFRYDNNNMIYDKNYSAYMLFYQRSNKLQQHGQASIPTPLKVDLPEQLLEHIRHENSFILRRHCLYDPNHTEFVHRVVKTCIGQSGRACVSDHGMERLAMQVTLGHLDQVVSRTKDAPQFPEYNDLLNAALFKCADCAYNFFEYFSERSEAFRCLLQRNPEPLVRSECGDLLITALVKIKEESPHRYGTLGTALSTNRAAGWVDTRDAVVAEVPYLFDAAWSAFHSNLRSWKEVFGTMLRYARLGDLETILLLDHDYLLKLVRLIQADPQMELTPSYHRMLSNVLRRAHNRPPNYEAIIMLIDQMMSVLHPVFTADHIIEKAENRLLMYAHDDSTPPWTSPELLTIHQDWQSGDQGNIFVMKLLETNQAPEATDKIIERLIEAGREMEAKVYNTLLANISALQGHLNAPYLRAAVVFCRVADDRDLVLRLITHVAGQSARLNNAEGQAFVEFHNYVYRVPEPGADLGAWIIFFHLTMQIPKWAPHLLAYYDREVRYQTEEFLQKAVFDYGTEPKFDDDEGGKRRSEVIVEAARDLGLRCLYYLREQFVQRRVQVARDNLHSLQSMLARTSAYFEMEPELPGKDMEFAQLNQNVLEALKQITVDEIEEEGSGMSCDFDSGSDTLSPEWS